MAFPLSSTRHTTLSTVPAFVAATQSFFQVLLTEANLPAGMLDSSGSLSCKSGGGDILAYADVGGVTRYPLDVVSCDPQPGGGTAQILVLVPSVNAILSVPIEIYWGNAALDQPAANAPFGSQAVWPANHRAVYHLETTQPQDSTSNANNASNANGATVAGQIGNALDITAGGITAIPDAASLSFGDGAGNDDPLTIEVWLDTDADLGGIVSKNNFGGQYEWSLLQLADGAVWFVLAVPNASSAITLMSTAPSAGFHHFLVSYDGSRNVAGINIWIDTVLANGTPSGTTYAGMTPGISGVVLGNDFFQGAAGFVIDELRLSDTVPAAGYTDTSYANQSSPGTFCANSGIDVPDVATVKPSNLYYWYQ